MSDHHSQYLTDEPTVDTIYSFLKANDLASATAYILTFGDDKSVMKSWIALQCDINNVKNDPYASEAFAREGLKFALARDFKTGAAILLHNLCAFHMKNWDENVDPSVIPGIIEASSKQVVLREQLDDKNSLGWAYWDHGIALLAGAKLTEAISAFQQTVKVAEMIDDKDLAAWANLFIGKAIIKSSNAEREEGQRRMLSAANIIREVGEDWEKDEVMKILTTVGL